MFALAWESKYEIGIETIDAQHKEFFEKINLYNMKCDKKSNYYETMELLNDLLDFTIRHFQLEEVYMITSKYPLTYNHQALHKNLQFEVKRLNTLMKREETDKEVLVAETREFVVKWLKQHFAEDDYKFLEYYRSLNKS